MGIRSGPQRRLDIDLEDRLGRIVFVILDSQGNGIVAENIPSTDEGFDLTVSWSIS